VAWVRLADDFADHPKIVAAGPLAGWLWTCGLAYANRYLTDGFIPQAQVRRLADVEDAYGLASRLVEVGLWERAEGGFRIHDYHGYQPTADDVKRERQATADRQAAWRERQRLAKLGNGVSNSVSNPPDNAAPARPGPGPVNPVPAGTSSPTPPPQAEEGDAAGAADKKRRGGRRNGVVHDETDPVAESDRTPATPGDREVWNRAWGMASAGMTASNAERLGMLEPLGRAADGGLHLRAPPRSGLKRFRNHVARALLDAGDAAAARVAIVEGRPGESEG